MFNLIAGLTGFLEGLVSGFRKTLIEKEKLKC